MKKDLDILSKIAKVNTPNDLYCKIESMVSNTKLSAASKNYKLAFSVAAMFILAFNIAIIYQYYSSQNNTEVQPKRASSDYSLVQNDIYND